MIGEYPAICQGEHNFVPGKEIVTPTCGAFSGADVVAELMVIYSGKEKDYQPEEGDICTKCFQVFGQEVGVKDQRLVETWRILQGLQYPPISQTRVSEPYVSPF